MPGRANRWLSHIVDQAFVGFPSAARRLHTRNIVTTGTPIRPQFQPADVSSCRVALGLDSNAPVVLFMGGSQGASRINECAEKTVPQLLSSAPRTQFIHLTGSRDFERLDAFYKGLPCRAFVRPFFSEMEFVLGATTVAVSRAGASSLAELAAMRVPAVLIPYPTAADNHQVFNARALSDAGAALMLEQRDLTPEKLLELIRKLLENPAAHAAMREELIRWHAPRAARQIASKILNLMRAFGLDRAEVTTYAAHAA
jgi:UDP-N-acetylglucosamine--N-acetylmuramyl-(pentapeptide) pyrophosphoryl-undecaprenol N-acetylglucosamine transferase